MSTWNVDKGYRAHSLYGYDDNYEGWYALLLAIEEEMTCDEAFRVLAGERTRQLLTQKEIDHIDELRANGYRWIDIADIYGGRSSKKSAHTRSSAMHHKYTRSKARLKEIKENEEKANKIYAERKSGKPWKEIAKKYGINVSTLSNFVYNYSTDRRKEKEND